MIVYTVRHIQTGIYLSNDPGGTYWEPTSKYCQQPPIPRLFVSEASARSFITAWVRGHAKANLQTEGGWEEPTYMVTSGVIYATPEIPRTRSDLEIVPWRLELA